MDILGERIKAARIRCGMTQEQLATALNTTKAAISRYEAGKRRPNLNLLSKIAQATKTTVSELVEDGYWATVPKYEYEASFSDTPNRIILMGLIEQLSEEGRQKAIEQITDLLEDANNRK